MKHSMNSDKRSPVDLRVSFSDTNNYFLANYSEAIYLSTVINIYITEEYNITHNVPVVTDSLL